MRDKEKYITTAELARMLGISRVAALKRVKNMVKDGRIKATELGRGFVI